MCVCGRYPAACKLSGAAGRNVNDFLMLFSNILQVNDLLLSAIEHFREYAALPVNSQLCQLPCRFHGAWALRVRKQ